MNDEEKKQARAQCFINQEDLKKRLMGDEKIIQRIAANGIKTQEDAIVAQAVCCWFLAGALYEEALMKDKLAGSQYETDLDQWLDHLTNKGEDDETQK